MTFITAEPPKESPINAIICSSIAVMMVGLILGQVMVYPKTIK
jgi:hypothetical protein